MQTVVRISYQNFADLHENQIYSIAVWKDHAIVYAIAYAILNSMKNLRFDKEGYFHVLVFYGLFYKRNRKHFSCVTCKRYSSRNTGRTLRAHVPNSISHSPVLWFIPRRRSLLNVPFFSNATLIYISIQ